MKQILIPGKQKPLIMKQILQLSALIFFIAFINLGNVDAQTRYVDEVFSNVTVTSNVVYGNNLTIITGTPVPEDLLIDIYEPTGDTLTERPLIIHAHSGSFLPYPINGGCTGTKEDSVVVEMCTQFAKRGYVAVALTYRMGWNPYAADEEDRVGGILNAIYRSIQDAHTCVRFFRENYEIGGNTYGIDTSRIVFC